MKQYMELVRHIKDHGNFKSDRTGTGTYSIFGHQMRFDLSKGFPLVTAKHTLGEFIWTGGDCHLYANHTEQVDILLSRKTYPLPTMKINPEVKDIFDFKFSDFELLNYVSGPVISAPIAV